MLRTLNTIFQLQAYSFANRIIYYIQRLPLIGRRIGDGIYSSRGLKKAGVIAGLLFSIVRGLLASLLYIGVLIYLPILTLGAELSPERQLDTFWHIFLILTFIVSGVSSARVLEPKREKYIAVKLMRIPAARYMRATLGGKYAGLFIYWLAALIVCSSQLGASALQCALVTVSAVMWRRPSWSSTSTIFRLECIV